MTTTLLVIWVAVIVLPTGFVTWFDGLALSSWAEAVAFAAGLPLGLSAALRRGLGVALGRWPRRVRLGLYGTVALALALKLGLMTAPPSGFRACYESVLSPPPAGKCERSFENPFFWHASTRIDRTLDFGPHEWNLSFFNSLRFNLDPVKSGLRRRDRLPFAATWRGEIESRGGPATITYVGEGVVVVGQVRVNLPPAYEREGTVRTSLPSGRLRLRVHYVFDDQSVSGPAPTTPYATFRLIQDAAGKPTPILSAAPSVLTVAMALLLNAVVAGVSLALLVWYAWLVRRDGPVVALLITVMAAAYTASVVGVPPAVSATAVSWALLASLVRRNRSARLLTGFFVLLVVGIWLAAAVHGDTRKVVHRSAGDDWLAYESFARTVLETWSLEAGEQVFYVQPLFRYVRFFEHFLLGDGDLLIDAFGWATLSWCILWAASLMFSRTLSGWRQLMFVVSGSATLALAASQQAFMTIRLSLSEHVTWIFLAAAFALLGSRQTGHWKFGGAALGAALITRPNQAPGLLAIAAAFLGARLRTKPRAAAWTLAVLITVCLLPLTHNLYYGRRPVLFTTTATHPATLGVPISTLAKIATDPVARAEVATQVRGLLFVPPLPSVPMDWRAFRAIVRTLQVVWVAAVVFALRSRQSPSIRLLVLAPVLYLGVHIVYDIRVYYPRHVLAAYFAMGMVAMATAGARVRKRSACKEQDGTL